MVSLEAPRDTLDRPPEDGEWSIEISPTLLFRFSALTYNGHRIHYDRDYARDVEGYPGLVTHGPLQALAMAEAARARGATPDDVRVPSRRPALRAPGARRHRRHGPRSQRTPDRPGHAHVCLTTRNSARRCAISARASPTRTGAARPGARIPAAVRRRAHRVAPARRADPDRVRRPRARPDRGQRRHGGDQPLRRPLRRLPRADVHDGRRPAPRQRRAETRLSPRIASGELRLQAFSITEDEAGSDTASIATTARREGDEYVIDGHKNWTSRIEQSDLLLLLARTGTPEARANGLSLFLIDLREVPRRAARGHAGADDVQLRDQRRSATANCGFPPTA